ncbi:hypothetical protein [Bradyrhizobium genosp. P]|uniref:hypothetical protein n=1 Tax=Bradyrhizobium genosp. P TaxID=83641 RepID=UPI003CFB61DF
MPINTEPIISTPADGPPARDANRASPTTTTTVDVPGATETNILGIDPSGDIFGYYDDAGYQQHGFVRVSAPIVIEAFGSTSLVQAGNVYDLDPVAGGTGPTLKYQGSAITVGEFAGWSPIDAEATSTGYDVAWKLAGANEYTVCATGTNGNDTVQTDAHLTDLAGHNFFH